MDLIKQYFPHLQSEQLLQFEALVPLYEEWNAKINVVSRKDIENLAIRHILHSLLVPKFVSFKSGATILDLGCGGGFPGIPLAIFYPDVTFDLIDARSKKIIVVNAIKDELQLKNVKAIHGRAEELKSRYDFVVTRAVAKADKLVLWSRKLIKHKQVHSMPNGIIALKGGNLKEELGLLEKWEYTELHPASKYFKEPFFEEKNLLYIQG